MKRGWLERCNAAGLGVIWILAALNLADSIAVFALLFMVGSAVLLVALKGTASGILPGRILVSGLDKVTFGLGDVAQSMDEIAGSSVNKLLR